MFDEIWGDFGWLWIHGAVFAKVTDTPTSLEGTGFGGEEVMLNKS